MKGLWSRESGETPAVTPAKQRAQGQFSGKQSTRSRTVEEKKRDAAVRAEEAQSEAFFSPPSRSVPRPPASQQLSVSGSQRPPANRRLFENEPQTGPIIEEPSSSVDPQGLAPDSGPRVTEIPPTPSSGTAAPKPKDKAADKAKMQEDAVRDLARSINHLLARSLTNMLDLMGSVCWKLGDNDVRHSLVYLPHGPKDKRDDPLSFLRIIDEDDPNLTTMSYFFSVYAPKLGMRFLQMYFKSWIEYQKGETEKLLLVEEPAKKKPAVAKPTKSQIPLVGASHCFDFQEDLDRPFAFGEEVIQDDDRIQRLKNEITTRRNRQGEAVDVSVYARQLVHEKMRKKAQDLLSLSEPEMAFAPAWAFELLSSDVFRAFVAPARLAAVDLAHAQVTRIRGCETFTIKELICSKGVVDQFAWMIAYQYMDASKGLPMHRPKGEKGERGIYVNINHMRETVQKRAFLCTIWFESVRAFPNPILAQFTEYKAKQYARATQVKLLDTPEKEIAWNAAMDMYYESLPKRELKYVGQ